MLPGGTEESHEGWERGTISLHPSLKGDYNVITMRAELIRIGNSRGIRIPKPLIEECGLGDSVELRVVDKRIVVSPERVPRQGWAAAFRKAGRADRDELLLDLPESEFDRKEWHW